MRNGIITDTLTSVDFVDLVRSGVDVMEVYGGFFCHNLEYNLIQKLLLKCLKKEINLKHKKKIYFKT